MHLTSLDYAPAASAAVAKPARRRWPWRRLPRNTPWLQETVWRGLPKCDSYHFQWYQFSVRNCDEWNKYFEKAYEILTSSHSDSAVDAQPFALVHLRAVECRVILVWPSRSHLWVYQKHLLIRSEGSIIVSRSRRHHEQKMGLPSRQPERSKHGQCLRASVHDDEDETEWDGGRFEVLEVDGQLDLQRAIPLWFLFIHSSALHCFSKENIKIM